MGGNRAPGVCTWQFNFKYDLKSEIFASDSIDMLQRAGLDFRAHQEHGIDALEFGELIMTSGLVLNDEVQWLTFHSGYDFGYLLKLLSCCDLPLQELDFFVLLKLYFPRLFDLKFLMKSCEDLHGGLQRLADTLGVKRVGCAHTAGSDADLTGATFFELRS